MFSNYKDKHWVLLKNNVGEKDYFTELCVEIGDNVSSCTVYAGTDLWIPPEGVRLIHAPLYIKKNSITNSFIKRLGFS